MSDPRAYISALHRHLAAKSWDLDRIEIRVVTGAIVRVTLECLGGRVTYDADVFERLAAEFATPDNPAAIHLDAVYRSLQQSAVPELPSPVPFDPYAAIGNSLRSVSLTPARPLPCSHGHIGQCPVCRP